MESYYKKKKKYDSYSKKAIIEQRKLIRTPRFIINFRGGM